MRWWRTRSSLLVAVALGACSRTPSSRPITAPMPSPAAAEVAPAPPPSSSAAPQRSEASCIVSIEVVGKTYSGQAAGTGDSTKPLEQSAFDAACSAMKAAESVGCEDRARFTYSVSSHSSFVSGKVSHSVEYTVRPVLELRTASASSATDWHDACLKAVRQACPTSTPELSCAPRTVSCAVSPDGSAQCAPIRSSPLDRERTPLEAAPFPW